MARRTASQASRPAEILEEYGPFAEVSRVGGVTFDGKDVWFAAGDRIQSFDPASGKPGRAVPMTAEAGTAFDGRHLYQLSRGIIHKVDPRSGEVLSTLPSPAPNCAGMTWAEGSLWVAAHHDRKIHQVDPETGRVLRTIDAARFVTGVTFVEGDLWYGTWEEDASDLRRADPESGEVLETLTVPDDVRISGVESDGGDRLFCGDGHAKVRAVRRPRG
ncbi:MAG TPA: PQQ-binding-like beta-propeller repeat protein [Polyangiaceae bacterium]|nr:PQQ-binding-like beta-propeller repeat protein [Polyangiaceae bacterium]